MTTYRSWQTYRAESDALGDPTRRAIFERLAEQPRAVGELARELPVSRPAVSQHLKVLKDAGLVIDQHRQHPPDLPARPRGTGRPAGYLDHFWEQALAGFKTARRATSEETQ